ncbi:LLM class oxidoreductase [Cellvibrio polysaccharolyticus]|uniref:LLM class oxidoreductase n=1 Tax=Cellvibrio polysaccharolyticus TaxID=2082724 RepID=A0A928UYS8_9GAMM|nr:LLM class oxidoreductase [Cellvibrio polysaccharolyticus]MBE8715711.1 LLM class oxidoreductase [Cellvibrio polysaccharolyticus]
MSIEPLSNHPFSTHPGFQRMFAPGQMTLGMFLPLRFYRGDMKILAGQSRLVSAMDRLGFAAVWVRDIPLFDPAFGDAGQVFDPFTWLAFLAAKTSHISLATGSAIFPLRHPLDLAKAATTIDQLSGGRLIMGIASGDRAVEFPAYGIDRESRGERFAQTVDMFRQLVSKNTSLMDGSLGRIDSSQFLPKACHGAVPLLVTGSSRQTLPWIAEQADGWLTYPDSTHDRQGSLRLAEKIAAWRRLIPGNVFKPHVTNEWLDLVDDPDFPRTPIHNGFVLRTGRNGLIELLNQWRLAGVNHAALGIQYAERPAEAVIEELAEYVLPLFPSLAALPTQTDW